MLVKLYENNPDQKQIDRIVQLLQYGGVIIYPTDTVYGIGCDITKARAVERVVDLYLRARYGGQPLGKSERRELREALAVARRTLRTRS